MQAEREQSWRIHVTAKANNFNFRFRFRFNNPTWTLSLCRLSIVLKLRKFVFRINSHPTQPIAQPQPKNGGGFIRAKVMKIVHKIRSRLPKTRPNIAAAKRTSNLPFPKDPICIVMGFLAFLAQSISKKDQKGIMMLASVWLLFKKFKTAKLMNLAAFLLVVATMMFMFVRTESEEDSTAVCVVFLSLCFTISAILFIEYGFRVYFKLSLFLFLGLFTKVQIG